MLIILTPIITCYNHFILEQLSEAPNITCRPMMGEFLLYSDGILFGGIYDDRLLVKIVPENAKYHLPEATPYPAAKQGLKLLRRQK